MNSSTRAFLRSPIARFADVAERLSRVGLDPLGCTPEEMTDTVRRDVAQFAKLVSSIGIQPE